MGCTKTQVEQPCVRISSTEAVCADPGRLGTPCGRRMHSSWHGASGGARSTPAISLAPR